ncbi:SRPBCC family protein [Nonomuraea pusilla]|uniref:SRPBCC family protein n=1 Tax=Nonomuraea pusilla TaxID=46177 RepID=UPI00332995B2
MKTTAEGRTGQEPSTMHRYDVTVTTGASPDIVWKLLVDAASWPLWSNVDSLDTTRSVGLDPGGDDGVGAVRAFRTGRRVTGERLTEKDERRLLAYEDAFNPSMRNYRAHRADARARLGHGHPLVRRVRDDLVPALDHAALPADVHAGHGGGAGPLRRGAKHMPAR